MLSRKRLGLAVPGIHVSNYAYSRIVRKHALNARRHLFCAIRH
jgi:hypothetical protein